MRFEQSESLVVETAEPAQHAPRKRLVHDIHQLRGVAILGVVLLHAIGMFIQVEMPPMAEGGLTWYASVLSTVLFHDFTILFTFISGVLFSALQQGAGWQRFYEKKIKYVLLPYLLMSAVFSLFAWSMTDGLTVLPLDAATYFSGLGKNLLLGAAQWPYWYIPVVSFLFLMTPLLLRAVEHAKGRWFVVGMALLPLVVSRTDTRLTVEIFGYFLGVYTVGLFWGKNHEAYVARLRPYLAHMALAFVGTSIVLLVLKIHDINLVRPVLIQESFFYIQKMALTGLLLVLLQRELKIPFLGQLATYSFTIYFLHTFVLQGVLYPWHAAGLTPASVFGGFISASAYVICVIAVSLGMSKVFHTVLGHRARLLVG